MDYDNSINYADEISLLLRSIKDEDTLVLIYGFVMALVEKNIA